MSGRRPRRSSRCPRPLSAMRTDVRPPGRADVRCPGDRCPGDWCPRDWCPRDWRPYDRGDPGVRTARRPMSAAAAAALSAPCWIPDVVRRDDHGWRTGFDMSLRPAGGVVAAARSGLAGKGWSNVGSAWLARASTAALAAAWQAHRLRRRALADPGKLVNARCRWVGRGSRRRSRCSQVSPQARPEQVARRDARPGAGPGGW
jgi:hypothetical protein